MCVCTPEIKTPWCGKPGCEMPKQNPVEKIDWNTIDWDGPRFSKRELITLAMFAIGQVNVITAQLGSDVVSACNNPDSKGKFETMAAVFGFLTALPESEIHDGAKEVSELVDYFIQAVKSAKKIYTTVGRSR